MATAEIASEEPMMAAEAPAMAAQAPSSAESADASPAEAPAMAAEAPSSAPAVASSSEAPAAAAAASEEPAMAAAAPSVAPKLPASGLSTDTLAAAPGNADEGYGYVGVWAVNAEACATVDQAGGSGYAVITSATFRDGPSASYGNFGQMQNGALTAKAGGASGQRTIALAQATPDELNIDGTAYIRCTP